MRDAPRNRTQSRKATGHSDDRTIDSIVSTGEPLEATCRCANPNVRAYIAAALCPSIRLPSLFISISLSLSLSSALLHQGRLHQR